MSKSLSEQVNDSRLPSSGFPSVARASDLIPETLSETLARHARDIGEKIALEFPSRSLTYADLDAESTSVAKGLKAVGVAPGDLVAVLLTNVPEMAISIFALARAGAVAVPVNVNLRGEPLEHILRQSAAEHVICSKEMLEKLLAHSSSRTEPYKTVVIVGEGDDSETGSSIEFEDLHQRGQSGELPEVIGTSTWAVMYTSGTTGPSKGAVLSHRFLALQSREIRNLMEGRPDSVWYTCLPLYHLNGLIYGLTAAVQSGSKAVIRNKFPGWAFLDDLRQAGATITAAPPFIPLGLLDQPEQDSDGKIPLESIGTYGLNPEQWSTFERRFNAKIKGAYGPTETGIVTGFHNDGGDVPGTSGRPLGHVEVALLNNDGDLVPRGEVGEIVVRPRFGGVIMNGYHANPVATVAAWQGQWFHTGDAARFDEDGSLIFSDRLKDMIKRRGMNVSSFEVEAALTEHPDVAEAAVVAFREGGSIEEEVRAFVKPGAGSTIRAESILTFVNQRLAHYMVPRYLDVVDEFPRNHIGKIDKVALRVLEVNQATYDRVARKLKLDR